MPPAFALGVDFGTSNTVALMRWPDGRIRPLLFDASPLLPSAVFAPRSGELVVGGDALHHARFDPAGLEPNPKQHIDDQSVLLGAREVAVVDLIAAVLRHVATEARRVAGDAAISVALSHPAGWGPARRQVLAGAARAAGLGDLGGGEPGFVAEPVAAGTYFTTVLEQQVPAGRAVVVYDLGAGTFDASVLVRRDTTFEVVAVDGIADVGGLDIDATIVQWLNDRYSPAAPELWARLTDAQDVESLRHRRVLWNDARVAKEMLSRAPAVVLQMPAPLDVDAQLTREEFEAAAGPLIERTVQTVAAQLRQAGVAPDDIQGILLVGGGSRIPLVATMLHRALGVAPTVTEQPEIVVAEGALLSLAAQPAAPPASEPRRARGTLYQTGQFSTVVPRQETGPVPSPAISVPAGASLGTPASMRTAARASVRRFVPPPAAAPAPPSASEPSRVVPVWTPGAHPAQAPRNPSLAPIEPAKRRWIAPVLVGACALLLLAGVGWIAFRSWNGSAPSDRSDPQAGAQTQVSTNATTQSETSPTQPAGELVTVPCQWINTEQRRYVSQQLRDAKLTVKQVPRDDSNPIPGTVLEVQPCGEVAQGSEVTLFYQAGALPEQSTSEP